VQAFFDDLARDSNVGGDAPAAPSTALMAAGFLSEQRLPEGRQAGNRLGFDDAADGLGGDGGHVHPHRVLGVVAESQVHRVADDVRRHVEEFAVVRRLLRGLLQRREVVAGPRTSASASATSATRNTGAQVIPDLRTRAVAPPALLMTEQPRLTDARSAPSVVARGGTSRRRRSRRRR